MGNSAHHNNCIQYTQLLLPHIPQWIAKVIYTSPWLSSTCFIFVVTSPSFSPSSSPPTVSVVILPFSSSSFLYSSPFLSPSPASSLSSFYALLRSCFFSNFFFLLTADHLSLFLSQLLLFWNNKQAMQQVSRYTNTEWGHFHASLWG